MSKRSKPACQVFSGDSGKFSCFLCAADCPQRMCVSATQWLISSRSVSFGGLYDFLNLLFRASQELAKAYTLESWSKRLLYYVDLLFPAENMDAVQQAGKQQINEILLELSDTASDISND
jgi:hypothetical protein